MYESKGEAPIGRADFARRLLAHLVVASAVVIGSLGLGMVGYVVFEHLTWVDAFLNAAMLLGGMGPVDPPQTVAGKVFAGLYALYAGLLFVVTAGMLAAPVLHRVLHVFHSDEAD